MPAARSTPSCQKGSRSGVAPPPTHGLLAKYSNDSVSGKGAAESGQSPPKWGCTSGRRRNRSPHRGFSSTFRPGVSTEGLKFLVSTGPTQNRPLGSQEIGAEELLPDPWYNMATWQGPGWTLGQAENPDLLHARHSGRISESKSSPTPEPWQQASSTLNSRTATYGLKQGLNEVKDR